MKRAIISLGLVLSLMPYDSFTQIIPSSTFSNDWEIKAATRSGGKLNYANIEGTPYYTRVPVECAVVMSDGSTANALLRYDLFIDEMEYKSNDLTLWINKKDIRSIDYRGDLIQVFPLPDDPGKLGYFFVLATGKYSFYSRKSVAYNPYVPAKPYADPIPEKFVNRKDEYYLKTDNEPLQQIASKKVLSKMFSSNKPVLDFIKNEKIKYNDPEDLLKLAAFLNK